MKFIAIIIGLLSFSAFAKYECTMKMSHVDHPEKVVAAKLITIEEGIRSGSEGEILQGIDVEAYLNGQVAEEEIEIILNMSERSSDKISLKGNSQSVQWFDSYKVETSCQS